MNTSVLNDSRQLVYSGLTERLVAEKLVAASAVPRLAIRHVIRASRLYKCCLMEST